MTIEDKLATDVVLAAETTYRCGGPARFFLEAHTEGDVADAYRFARSRNLEILVLGRGSNLVVADAGFPGVVLRLGSGFGEIEMLDGGSVRAGAAVPLPVLARTAVKAGRGGLEFYVGIPGSVGGAVRMNAGCFGSETASVLVEARMFRSGRFDVVAGEDLGFRYRHSNVSGSDLVVGAVFTTRPIDPAEGERAMREVTRWRRDNQPGGTFNAGSVFKNPPGDAAGRVIDELGLKGFRVGGAAVSEKHANFFVADAGATAQDIYELVWAVRRRVGEATGIWLQPEIQFAGPFRESADAGAGP